MEAVVIGEHCRVSLIEEVPCIMIQWFGLPPTEEFRKGCNAVLEMMKQYSVTKILTDNSKVKVFSVTDQKWLNETWLPKAEALGYRVSATLVAEEDPFVTFAVKNIMANRDPKKYKARFFTKYDEAIQWLKEC